MRVMNLAGRLALAVDGGAIDVATASAGRFGPDVQSVYQQWPAFEQWARTHLSGGPGGVTAFDEADLLAPVPRPPQVFAVGLNFRDHAEEAGLELPDSPMVFTKFPASVTGPFATITLPRGSVDFEAELVAVIGREASHVAEADVWSHIAGLTCGQDLSERELQLSGPAPAQYNLGKSFTGFAPIGPYLVTPDDFPDPDDVELECSLSGELMQKSHTGNLIFSIPQIVAHLSSILTLWPGDLVFTGTPSGIGWTREPRRLITKNDELVTTMAGIGSMRHTFAATAPAA
jgi:2-keto-4-pentenoate hydratase/2-oxohepta-3-ene-1,7-dioic acid hydratase in catechol pathway